MWTFASAGPAVGAWLRTRSVWRARARPPSATAKGVSYLSGRRLTFDKVSEDGSGKCDIEPTALQTDRVYGVLFEIANNEKARRLTGWSPQISLETGLQRTARFIQDHPDCYRPTEYAL